MLYTLIGDEKEKEEIKEIYNRYAHISIDLIKDETHLELLGADHFKIYLNYKQLKDLNVTYILSSRDLEGFSDDSINLEKIYSENSMNIYKVSY